jgi:hypothetical protein
MRCQPSAEGLRRIVRIALSSARIRSRSGDAPAAQATQRRRATKRDEIEKFFLDHLGVRFSTYRLHAIFGSAFRSRVSEINRSDNSPITIQNEVDPQTDGAEHSVYWSTRREA